MRVISGRLKGRRFLPPADFCGRRVRSITDQAKEVLFNILNHRVCFQNIRILDLFCGLRSLSYEFASRGAPEIRCVDIDYRCVKYVREVTQKFQIAQQIYAIQSDVFRFLSEDFADPYDLIFADPPYQMLRERLDLLVGLSLQPQWIKPSGLIILEHSSRHDTFHHNPCYKETKRYGQICFSFFERLPQ